VFENRVLWRRIALKVEVNESFEQMHNDNFYTSKQTNKHVRFEVFTAVTMKNGVSGLLRRVALVRTDVSEEPDASFIRVTKIGELGTTSCN
jgi:hypothetical protein